MTNIQPQRQINFIQTISIIIGAVIGSGVFLNLPTVAKFAGSPGISVLIWFIGGVLWLPQILILAEMGTAYPTQGGPYYFLYKAGSPFLAFLYTWTAFLTSDTPTITIIALSATSAISFFIPILNDQIYAKIFAAVLIGVIAAIQYRSVKTGSNFQIVLTASKLLPLIAIVLIGLFFLNNGNLYFAPKVENTNSSFLSQVTAGISATLWAYAGFINILYMAGEVKNPAKILPRALFGSLIFVAISYTLISLCVSAIVPFNKLVEADGTFINPFVYLNFFSKYAGGFFAIATFISMIGVLNSVIMTQPRLEYAMAKDGLFFKSFGHLHPKYLTPDYSITIQSCLAILLFVLGDINTLLGYFTLSYVLQNALVYGAIFFLRKQKDYQPTYRVRFAFSLAGISIIIQLYIAVGTFMAFPAAGILACLFLIISGLPIYWNYYKKKKI